MVKFFRRLLCALFGHEWVTFRYVIKSGPYNEAHQRFGMKCIHCGKVKL